MNIVVKRWSPPDDGQGPPVPETATFTTKREFEALFENPLVASRIIEVVRNADWVDRQYLVRVPAQLARRYGISTWNDHASLYVDHECETDSSLYVQEQYTERGSLTPPGEGQLREIDSPLPKAKIAVYEGEVDHENECWNCGTDLYSDRRNRILIVAKRHFTNKEFIPEEYPHPDRAEYLCDDCTYGIVTSDDVDRYGDECIVCDRLKATCVERVLVPEDVAPEDVDRDDLPSAVSCATCVEREDIDFLKRKFD